MTLVFDPGEQDTGDLIGGFKVVRIGQFRVKLASKDKTISLEMIEND